MTDVFTLYGYRFAGSCNCNGYYTEKYRKGTTRIRWRRRHYKFKVEQYGGEHAGWQPISKLKEVLDELDNTNVQTKA